MEQMIPNFNKVETNKESKEGSFENLQKQLKRLALLGVVFGGSFLAEAQAQEMKPGTISKENSMYKMTEQENKEIIDLSIEVDSLTRVLQNELKEKVPVTTIDEFINDEKVASRKSYIYQNIQVGAEGSWQTDYKGDTLKNSNDVTKYEDKEYGGGVWVHVSDKTLDEMGENSLTRESLTFGGHGKDVFDVLNYTNKTGKETGGKMTFFEYGEHLIENNAILVDNANDIDEISSPNATKDSGKNLKTALQKLKDTLSTKITSLRGSK